MFVVSSKVSTALVCLGFGLVGLSLLTGRPRRRGEGARSPAGASAADLALQEVVPDPAQQFTG